MRCSPYSSSEFIEFIVVKEQCGYISYQSWHYRINGVAWVERPDGSIFKITSEEMVYSGGLNGENVEKYIVDRILNFDAPKYRVAS